MTQTKIIVVDDIEVNALMLSYLLEDVCDQIDIALSARDAIKLCQENQYSLAIIDVCMPEMDGFECLRKIRESSDNINMLALLISANRLDTKSIELGYEIGAIDYLRKPINDEEIHSKVRALLNMYHKIETNTEGLYALKKHFQYSFEILNEAGEGIIAFNDSFNVTYVNKAACLLMTQTAANLVGSELKAIISPHATNDEWDSCDFVSIFNDGQCNHNDDFHFWRDESTNFPVQYTQTTISNRNKKSGVLFFLDNSETLRIKNELTSLANYDQLTKIANRKHFMSFTQQMLSRAERVGTLVAVLLIDLDNFKTVNDTLGHHFGDKLLSIFSEMLGNTIRREDMVGRLGGDEFGVVAADLADAGEAAKIAEKICSLLNETIVVDGAEIHTTCSVGISLYPDNGNTENELLKQADTAMYHAKSLGKNQFCFYSKSIQAQIEKKAKIAKNLRAAIKEKDFETYFQPQFNLATGFIIGAEALIRWQNADGIFVSPALFIPIAEEIGVIDSVDSWCVNSVCETIRRLVDDSVVDEQFKFGINISAKQLSNPECMSILKNAINANDVSVSNLCIEITETAVMEDPVQAIDLLAQLRGFGINIAVDDFGTGYSSLAYLKKLPIDQLKIDREFVNEIGQDENDEAIIKAIIQLAKVLELEVIAEGIETQVQHDFLVESGCNLGQGFLYSRPLPLDDFTSFCLSCQQATRNNTQQHPAFYKSEIRG